MKKTTLILTFGLFLLPLISLSANEVQQYKLKNGLQLFVKVDNRAPVVVSQIWYKVGSSYEQNGVTGISHMLEHMMFQGTKQYPGGSFAKKITENGAEFNAMTSNDFTLYYEKSAADKLPLLFQLEADRMQNLNLNEQSFVKEMKVVQEERRMRTDNDPQNLSRERFAASAYITSPYHHPVIGWMGDLEQMTLTDVINWYKAWYNPSNAIIVVVGDVQPEAVFKLAERYFGDIPAQPLPHIILPANVTPLGTREVNVEIPAQLPWLFMGYNTPSLKTAQEQWQPYALETLAALLITGESSRLKKELVRGSQIASSVDVDYDLTSRFSGLFTITATPSPNHTIAQLHTALLQQLQQLQQQPVSAAELERVKNQLIAQKVFELDSSFYQAMQIGSLEAVGLNYRIADDYVANIEKITPAQIQAVAKEYLVPTRLTVGILKPL